MLLKLTPNKKLRKLTYEGMHDWLDPSSSKYMDTKIKSIKPIAVRSVTSKRTYEHYKRQPQRLVA